MINKIYDTYSRTVIKFQFIDFFTFVGYIRLYFITTMFVEA